MARSENNLDAVLQDTANAIRAKDGSSAEINPRDFADKVLAIPAGPTPTGTVNIDHNGTTNVTSYAYANVNVQPPYDNINLDDHLSELYYSRRGQYNGVDVKNYKSVKVSTPDLLFIPGGDHESDSDTWANYSAVINIGSYYNERLIKPLIRDNQKYVTVESLTKYAFDQNDHNYITLSGYLAVQPETIDSEQGQYSIKVIGSDRYNCNVYTGVSHDSTSKHNLLMIHYYGPFITRQNTYWDIKADTDNRFRIKVFPPADGSLTAEEAIDLLFKQHFTISVDVYDAFANRLYDDYYSTDKYEYNSDNVDITEYFDIYPAMSGSGSGS